MARVSGMAALMMVTLAMMCGATNALKVGFYSSSCPGVEDLILQKMKELSASQKDLFSVLLRLHFHDCFVRGCDASALLDIPNSERTAPPNARLEGFAAIETIKAAIEAKCPKTVSCADILAFTTRDSVKLSGGPPYEVPAGRRDGVVSMASEAVQFLPGHEFNVDQLTANFAVQGLSRDDMVFLSGAHTIGETACHHIDERIYTYPSNGGVDPNIPASFVQKLKKKCNQAGLTQRKFDLDTSTSSAFDTMYYSNLVSRIGTLQSDQVLYTDSRTRAQVVKFANDRAAFFVGFTNAMIKMGSNPNNLEGSQGQIRTQCSHVNQ